MSGEHRVPATKALDEIILIKLCPLLVALFLCLSVTNGNVPAEAKHVTAALGDDVILFCGFEFPENKSEPYSIEWLKQGIQQPIYNWLDGISWYSGKAYKGRLSLAHQASLNLTKVRLTDKGWYVCEVFFLYSGYSLRNGTCWVHLDVREKVPEEPEHVNATLGEGVVLFCGLEFPENKPEPYVIEWQKQGIKKPIYIRYNDHPPYSGFGYESRLSPAHQASIHLLKVHETDQGWYECRVYFLNRLHDFLKNGTWVHLDVYAPSKFKTKPPDVVYVKVGESVSLPCEAEDTYPLNLTWYKDNLPLEESGTVQILPTELRINNFRQTDIGHYSCMVRTKQRTISATSEVLKDGDFSNRCSAITAGVVFFFLAALSMSVWLYKFVLKGRKEKQGMLLISNRGSTGSRIDNLDDPLDDNRIKRHVVQ